MKYNIYSADYWRDKPNGILHAYPCLSNFNFRIEEIKANEKVYIRDETNKKIAQVVPKNKRLAYIDIDSIEQLMDLEKNVDHPLIVTTDEDYGPEIQIYDDYIE